MMIIDICHLFMTNPIKVQWQQQEYSNSCTKLTLNFLCELAVNYQKIHMMNRLIATLKSPYLPGPLY